LIVIPTIITTKKHDTAFAWLIAKAATSSAMFFQSCLC